MSVGRPFICDRADRAEASSVFRTSELILAGVWLSPGPHFRALHLSCSGSGGDRTGRQTDEMG